MRLTKIGCNTKSVCAGHPRLKMQSRLARVGRWRGHTRATRRSGVSRQTATQAREQRRRSAFTGRPTETTVSSAVCATALRTSPSACGAPQGQVSPDKADGIKDGVPVGRERDGATSTSSAARRRRGHEGRARRARDVRARRGPGGSHLTLLWGPGGSRERGSTVRVSLTREGHCRGRVAYTALVLAGPELGALQR